MKPLIAPSILAADHSNIARDLSEVPNSDWIHVDIMDNHFVPNLSFSSQMVKAVKGINVAPVDTHLMISKPENTIAKYIEAGSDSITFHLEATDKPEVCIEIVKAAQKKVAIAIKPKTTAKEILKYLTQLDMVLVMTVEPGFGGQKFMLDQMNKVKEIRDFISQSNLEIRLQVDGGVDEETILIAREAGADFFVAGSSVFNAQNPQAAIENLRNLALLG